MALSNSCRIPHAKCTGISRRPRFPRKDFSLALSGSRQSEDSASSRRSYTKRRLLSLPVLAFSCAAGLNVARADRNADGLSIPSGSAAALHDWVKAIPPETVVFFPLPLNKAQLFAFGDYSLARRVTLDGVVILSALRGLSLLGGAGGRGMNRCLCHNINADHDQHKKRA
jgi:hypothetical protein